MVRARIQGSKWDYLTPKRFDFVPDLLIVRIKRDVVANLPPKLGRATAARKKAALPEAVDEPIRALLRKGKLKQLTPVFAPMPTVRRFMKAAPCGSEGCACRQCVGSRKRGCERRGFA